MTEEADSYFTVSTGPEVELKEKGSRFLAQAFAVSSEEASRDHLEVVRKKYYTASHHCWAHRVGEPSRCVERADDDGEPSQTAGAPILAILQGEPLHGVLLVVTRYFGGTKLGKGGLIRAYGDAAKLALQETPRVTVWRETEFEVRCSYADVGAVEAVFARAGEILRSCERDFADEACFRLTTLQSDFDRVDAWLREATGARATVERR